MSLYRHCSLKLLLFIVVLFVIFYVLYNNGAQCGGTNVKYYMVKDETDHSSKSVVHYNEQMPLIFIGGMPRSGTTLVRAILDSHPVVRCGEETRVIPRLLQQRMQWKRSKVEDNRLSEAGLTDDVIDAAFRSFILEIIVRHGEPAPRLCDKDPFNLKSTGYLSHLFPNAKFILVIRDGRATAHSIISRKVTISGFDLTSYRDVLTKWNRAVGDMYMQCVTVGETTCLPVKYEEIVLHPEATIRMMLKFLDLPWNDVVLHHEDTIGLQGGISLSKVERSSDQVIKPVYLDALTKWVGKIPDDVVEDMAEIAPMLRSLGYDPLANPPNYGQPDNLALEKDKAAKNDERFRNLREAPPPEIPDVLLRGRHRPRNKGIYEVE